jgi:cellulose synthase/poly-beta-1,6-N-acetylglucosamine synthase-like glycosyltransferase
MPYPAASRARGTGALARQTLLSSPFRFRMFAFEVALAAAPLVIAVYAYVGYPALLWLIAASRRRRTPEPGTAWPSLTITVPVYNAAANIRATLDRLLEVDYPREQLQLLVISDASSDGTDEIVKEYASRGVELLRLPMRKGKTTAENVAVSVARGELIVNVDGTVLVPRESLKPLVRVFDDPTIGVASSRDVSVSEAGRDGVRAESQYVGYEMWVRDLETRVGSIVGASGCFYAIRKCVHEKPLRGDLSWDFASVLVARQQGYRSVSVPLATCMIPRTTQLRTEMTRKVRTMARGLNTLFHLRSLMNPIKYGSFAFMLISHKLLRWLPYLLAPVALLALALLATQNTVALGFFAVTTFGLVVGAVAVKRPGLTAVKPFAVAGFAVAAFTAGVMAWRAAIRQKRMATWDPTPRAELQS